MRVSGAALATIKKPWSKRCEVTDGQRSIQEEAGHEASHRRHRGGAELTLEDAMGFFAPCGYPIEAYLP